MKDDLPVTEARKKERPAGTPAGPEKKPFLKPKLRFIQPKLLRQGNLADVTGGFFGTFIP